VLRFFEVQPQLAQQPTELDSYGNSLKRNPVEIDRMFHNRQNLFGTNPLTAQYMAEMMDPFDLGFGEAQSFWTHPYTHFTLPYLNPDDVAHPRATNDAST
jgi:hypothetical protein